jgi:hypothetical protein
MRSGKLFGGYPSLAMSDFPRNLQVEEWPGLKLKVLAVEENGCSRVLARFVSDEAAMEFLELVNDRMKMAYRLGRQRGIERVH